MPTDLRSKLATGAPCIGGWLGTGSVVVADAVASCGFDWVAIDMEHGTAGVEDAAGILAAIQHRGAAAMVRLPSADVFLARRLLDAGADGLIVPVVEDAESFRQFSRHQLYPPAGRRGVGLARGNLWGDTFEETFNTFRPVLVAQIETAKGAANADAIAALDEIDGLFIGPYDLSADLGVAGKLTDPALTDALAQVKAACAKHGKAYGGHQVDPDPAALKLMIDGGFRFIAYSTDIIAMRSVFAAIRNVKS